MSQGSGKNTQQVFWTRAELQQLLNLYSTRVANGDWRDYAIDHKKGVAVFSVFRHTMERPMFSIAKKPQGQIYEVWQGPQRLKRAGTLKGALEVFEKKARLRVVS